MASIMPLGETIVAQGTPQGQSAIAAIRVSGPLVSELVKNIFSVEEINGVDPYLNLYISLDGKKLDEVVFIPYSSEGLYTGEDSLRLSPRQSSSFAVI